MLLEREYSFESQFRFWTLARWPGSSEFRRETGKVWSYGVHNNNNFSLRVGGTSVTREKSKFPLDVRQLHMLQSSNEGVYSHRAFDLNEDKLNAVSTEGRNRLAWIFIRRIYTPYIVYHTTLPCPIRIIDSLIRFKVASFAKGQRK